MPKPKRSRKSDPEPELELFKRELEDIRARAKATDIRVEESLKRLEGHLRRLRLAAGQ